MLRRNTTPGSYEVLPENFDCEPDIPLEVSFDEVSDSLLVQDPPDHISDGRTDLIGVKEEAKRKLLTPIEERILASRIEAGDTDAKNEMIFANQGLVFSIANKYSYRSKGLDLDDLTQEGMIGLMRAVEKFDFRRDRRFSTYATPWIHQAVTRAIKNKGSLIRIPLDVYGGVKAVINTEQDLKSKSGRTPTNKEIAEESGLKVGLVERVKDSKPLAGDPIPLHIKIDGSGLMTDGLSYEDVVADDRVDIENSVIEEISNDELRQAIDAELSPLQKSVIRDLYGLGGVNKQSLIDIARKHKMGRDKVKLIRDEARAIIKKILEER